MSLDSIKYFLKGECVITINNHTDLEKFIQQYESKYHRYKHPEDFGELLEAKRIMAFYPLYIIISGRFSKQIVTWHETQSRLYVNGVANG